MEAGLEAALNRKPLEKPPREIEFDGAFEARLTALACSDAPVPRMDWCIIPAQINAAFWILRIRRPVA